jgi:transmembrane sensor
MRQAEDRQNGQGNSLDAAMEWQVRLTSGHATEEDRFVHMAWLAESDDNLEAFERVKATWTGAEVARDAALSEDGALVEGFRPVDQEDRKGDLVSRLLSLFGGQTLSDTFGVVFAARYRPAFAVAAIAMVVGVLAGLPSEQTGPEPQQFASAVGDTAVYELPDESSVALDTNTRIRATYGEDERRLDLEEGVAFFDVAKDPDRPFIVNAGSFQAEAVGTKFEIGRLENELWVAVSEGQVKVSKALEQNQTEPVATIDPVFLSAGQQISVDMDGVWSAIGDVSTQAIGAWQHGYLIFRNARLDEVIGRLNRYADVQMIVLQDDALGATKVDGVLFVDEPAVLAGRLGEMLALGLQVESEVIRLTRSTR